MGFEPSEHFPKIAFLSRNGQAEPHDPPTITFFHYIFDGVSESLITFNGCLIFPLHFRVRWQWGPSLAAPGQKCDFWKVLGLARNPSKKMRLDESFRMVRVPCHLEVVVKSYGQITVWENVMGKWGRNVMDYIFGGIHWTPSKAVVIIRALIWILIWGLKMD